MNGRITLEFTCVIFINSKIEMRGMSTMYMAPSWFFGYDVIFELFFFIISLVIALYALKIYKTTDQESAGHFGYGFLIISVAYLLQSISNFLVYSELNKQICQVAKFASVTTIDAIGTYAYMLFMISGLVVLLFVSFKEEKKRMLWISWLVSVIAIALSKNPMYSFYLLSSIYLVFIAWHFLESYLKNRKAITLCVALAFIFLCFGSFHFVISVNHELYYVIGHILEFIAYILILVNWFMVRK